jgi:hypothetical protein
MNTMVFLPLCYLKLTMQTIILMEIIHPIEKESPNHSKIHNFISKATMVLFSISSTLRLRKRIQKKLKSAISLNIRNLVCAEERPNYWTFMTRRWVKNKSRTSKISTYYTQQKRSISEKKQ